jgi:hypothetical protein
MRTKLIFFLVVLGSRGFSQEAPKQIKRVNQLWGGYYSNVILNEKWAVNSDVQYRTKDWYEHPSQALIRTGLNYKINEKFNVTVGLAHFRFYLNDVVTRGEWRPWQEVAVTDSYKKLKITHRFRVEERFNQRTEKSHPIEKYGFSWRFRYKLDLQYQLISIKEKQKFSLTLGNEILINAGSEIVYNYFDQNRSSIGLFIELNKNFSIQPQFIYIWQQESNGKILDKISVIRLNLIHKIKL